MKRYLKKIIAIALALVLTLQVLPSSVFTSNAAESTSSTQTYVNEETGVMFEYYDEISEYRTGDYTYPKKEGYVFGGWWLDVSEASDAKATAVNETTTKGAAWAKFVPADVLSVKAQVSKAVSEVTSETEKVKLRLVTSVDSLRYQEVGFKVSIGSGKTSKLSSTEVYSDIVVTDGGRNFTETPKNVFHNASIRFATKKISGITMEMFTSYEFNVTPYWLTKDGTEVDGISRNRILVSDDLANESDGSSVGETEDFTVSDNKTYTYKTTASETNAASYKYFKGGSDTIYLKGTYTTADNNMFGISIRNGGETRQVFFADYGVKVMSNTDMTSVSNDYSTVKTNENGTYVWVQKYEKGNDIKSAVYDVVSGNSGTKTEVVWAIENNMLYCTVDGKVSARIPMNNLCLKWNTGRYYQVGVAGYNSEATSNMKFELDTLAFGKEAYGTEETPLLHREAEKLNTCNMIYEPINASYLGGSTESQFAQVFACTDPVDTNTPIAVETVVENWGDGDKETGVGITVVLNENHGGDSVQLLMFDDEYARLQGEYSWAGNGHFAKTKSVETKLTSKLPDSVTAGSKIQAAIYDDKLSVLVDGVSAFEYALEDLFVTTEKTTTYDAGDKVSIGIVSFDAEQGYTPVFSKVKTYKNQDAIDMKMKNWTFYNANSIPANTSASVAEGRVSSAPQGQDIDNEFMLSATEASIWQVNGKMSYTSTGDAHQGFSFRKGSDKWLNLWGNWRGFIFGSNNNPWSTANQGTYTNYTVTADASGNIDGSKGFMKGYFFGESQGAKEVDFQVVVAHNTVFVWLNGYFAWKVPLTETDFGSFEDGKAISMKLLVRANGNRTKKFEDIVVRTGSEVSSSLVDTLEYCKDLDWHGGDVKTRFTKELTKEGEIIVDVYTKNYTGTDIFSDVYSNVYSNNVLLSGTWTEVDDNALMHGIVLRDNAATPTTRRVCFNEGGLRIRTAPGAAAGESLGTWDYFWTSYAYSQNQAAGEGAYSSAKAMVTKNLAEKEHEIIWALHNGYLCIKIDGMINHIIPIEKICETWNADTKLSMGIGNYRTNVYGNTKVSNLKVYYGEEAEVLMRNTNQDIEPTTNMKYNPIDGEYVSRTNGTSGFIGTYGAATTDAVGLETDIQLFDIHSTDGTGAGISVKTDSGSIQLFHVVDYVGASEKYVRIQTNEKWENAQTVQGVTEVFDENGKINVKAFVNEGKLYVWYNGVPQVELELSKYIEGYKTTDAVQIGVASWDTNKGMASFKNINVLSKEEVEELLYTETLGENSTAWDITGTMKQDDVSTLIRQGFVIEDTNGNKLTLYGQDYGFVANETEHTTYTATDRSNGVLINDETYYNFFRSDGSRSETEIGFRMRLVNDKIRAWFNDVLVWDIDLQAYGFAAGSGYTVSVIAKDSTVKSNFANITTIAGEDVKPLFEVNSAIGSPGDEETSSAATINTMDGSVFENDVREYIYFAQSSDTWEVTGTMKRELLEDGTYGAVDNGQGFVIQRADKGDEVQEALIRGQGQGFAYWSDYYNTYSGRNNQTKDGARYIFPKPKSENSHAQSYFADDHLNYNEVQFRAVLVDDTLFVWFDGYLTWRIPLTATCFGGFEAGSEYYFGLSIDGASDKASVGFENVVVKTGGDADTTGILKYIYTTKAAGTTVDEVNGTAKLTAAGSTEYIYFAQDESSKDAKFSNKWEITGKIKREDMNTNSVIGFTVADESEHTATYNFWSGHAVSVGKGWPWTVRKAADYPENVFKNEDSEEFAQRHNGRDEIRYRIVILDDILYAYFNDQLTWKLPITEDAFGYTASVSGSTQTLKGFTAGSNYRLGIRRVDQTPITISNITVKTGNAVITQENLTIRDPYVLADEATGTYYLYGSRHKGTFDVFASKDLLVWKKQSACLNIKSLENWTDISENWAPEVFKYQGPDDEKAMYYMFATFTGTYKGTKIDRGTVVLRSDSPTGQFVEWSEGPVTPAECMCLDGTLYVEDNGDGTKTPYLVYCHEYSCGNFSCSVGDILDGGDKNVGTMMYVELTSNLKSCVGAATKLFSATEIYTYPSADGNGYVTDGPQLYSVNEELFLLWSTFKDGDNTTGNNQYIQIQMRSSDGTLAGLKTANAKKGLPLLYGNGSEDGGHGMLFKDFNNNLKLVLFTPNFYASASNAGEKSHPELFDISVENDATLGSYLKRK